MARDVSFKIDFSILKIRKATGDKLCISSSMHGEVVKLLLFVFVFLALCDVFITEHISTLLCFRIQ